MAHLGCRDIFAQALLDGLSVFELVPSCAGTAMLEARQLMEELDEYEHQAPAVA